jgi:hypothetical protein
VDEAFLDNVFLDFAVRAAFRRAIDELMVCTKLGLLIYSLGFSRTEPRKNRMEKLVPISNFLTLT